MKRLVSLGLALAASGCVSTSPYVPVVELGIGYEMPNRVIGDQPVVGIFRVHQPIVPEKLFLGYTHLSALDGRDVGTLDQFEFFVRMPLALER